MKNSSAARSRLRTRAGWNFLAHLLIAVIAATGLPSRTPAATTVTSFQAGTGNWQLGTIVVGNIDADAALEIVVPYRDNAGWKVAAYKSNGQLIAGFPYNAGANVANVTPTLHDLDGDGRNEIIFTAGTNIVALRGNGTVMWTAPVNRTNYIPNGGYMVVPGTFYWSAGGQLANLPSTAAFYSEVSPPIVADIDGDGKEEVVTAWKIDPDTTSSNQDYNPFINDIYGFGEWGTVGDDWSGGVVINDAKTGAKKFIYHLHTLIEAGLALGQPDDAAAAANKLQVYALNDSDSVVCFDSSKPNGFYGKGQLWKQFGKNQRLISGTYQLGVDLYSADIDGDGRDELLVPSRDINPLWQPSETILDDDGAILWRQWKNSVSYTHNYGWHNSASMIPCNPDHDNHVDVLTFSNSTKIYFRYWNGVELVDRPGWPKDFAPYLPTPPVVGDVDGDGQEEIIIGTYNPSANPSSGNLYVFALNGTLKQSIPVAGGLKHIPSLADLNSDGKLEVIYRSMAGMVNVVSFGTGNPNRVSWATHRGNAEHDGNMDVSLFPAGTPLVNSKTAGYKKATFAWKTPGYTPLGYTILRATNPAGPYGVIATLPAGASSFTDRNLNVGQMYLYEVQANYATQSLLSSPFNIVVDYNNDLVKNGGFEENSDSHWDKWYTGSIPWQNMVATNSAAYQGAKSMQIKLQNYPSNSSIIQYNQYGIPDSSIAVTPGKFYSFGAFFKSAGLSQSSEHWMEWNSSKTGTDTNTRPALPYPNYFTPHFKIGTSSTAWTYANRVLQMPTGFPNVELRHRYSVSANVSGNFCIDNVFFREIPAPSDLSWQPLITMGSAWKWWNFPSNTNPPSAWNQTAFSDASWPTGLAKFGTGSGPQGIVTQVPASKPKYYFRKTFVAAGPYEDLLLEAKCTDDVGGKNYPLEIWINGTSLVTTGIACTSGDGNTVLYYDLTPFLPLIQTGSNTIAVCLNNTWASSWDNVSFDIGLKAQLAK